MRANFGVGVRGSGRLDGEPDGGSWEAGSGARAAGGVHLAQTHAREHTRAERWVWRAGGREDDDMDMDMLCLRRLVNVNRSINHVAEQQKEEEANPPRHPPQMLSGRDGSVVRASEQAMLPGDREGPVGRLNLPCRATRAYPLNCYRTAQPVF